jgi:hypothetical protein
MRAVPNGLGSIIEAPRHEEPSFPVVALMAGKLTPTLDAFARVLPILGWLPTYEPRWLRADIIAGLTLWGILVPEAIAYAVMAGAPLPAGLYTLLSSFVLYAILGTTRQAVSAPTWSWSNCRPLELSPRPMRRR